MDPNEALDRLRAFVQQVNLHGRFTTETVESVAEAADALDTWLCAGGFLPEDWAKAQAR